MANLNIEADKTNTYDAIVIGSGVSGGWAAKELTEKGLRVLMLERGQKLDHVADYEYALKARSEERRVKQPTTENLPSNRSRPIRSSRGTIPTTR